MTGLREHDWSAPFCKPSRGLMTAMPNAEGPDDPGYIIEFHQVGNAVKVSALDPATLTEVSIVGAPTMTEAHLTRAVVRKLEFMLAKQRNK